MKIGVFGTGVVGNTIGSKLVQLGHEVMIGSRTRDNEKALSFVKSAGAGTSAGTFSDAAAFGKLLFNCTNGMGSLEALKLAGAMNMKGKVLIDVSNPLDFSRGFPPSLSVCNTDSLGEQIQRAFPETSVVKTLHTVNCYLMVNPSMLQGEHDLFMCGNDPAAKVTVEDILKNWFGWKNVIDLGDISNARGTEMLLPIWVRLYSKLGNANFNFHIVQ